MTIRKLSLRAAVLAAAGLIMSMPALAADSAKATVKDLKGNTVGTVTFTETPTGVMFKAAFKGLPPGVHGLHFHETGKCEPPFKTAGGHFNPGQAKHGLLNDDGPHAGDMPNIHVPASGELTVEVWNPMVTLQAEAEESLLDKDGTAIMVHSGPDDYKTDPHGGAGDRIACGVVQ
ncbi:MAG: superoxide dismutase family protein [Hyphomicrobiales bacterium]